MPELNSATALIINILLGIVLAGVGWWVKNIWTMLSEQTKAHNDMVLAFQKQVSDITLQLARDYVPRRELQETFTRIFDTLEEIKDGMRLPGNKPTKGQG